ncbi:MAG: DUF447 family protein [Gammaproteobacteria bacterium]
MIYESIVITERGDGVPHIAPLGIREVEGLTLLAPFRPSTTLDNLTRSGCAVINFTDDVRVFAGCLSGRREWPVRRAETIAGWVLEGALSHRELTVERLEDDSTRPRFLCREVYAATHGPFRGFNRAQAAVVEAAILVSRLHVLPADKIDREIDYLRIAIDKTAGPREREAWGWLLERIAEFRAEQARRNPPSYG